MPVAASDPIKQTLNPTAHRVRTPQTISVSDLKANAGRLLQAVRRGKSVTVTHRRKALARLVPLAQSAASGSSDGRIFRLAELAEPMGVLTNEQIDELVYGR